MSTNQVKLKNHSKRTLKVRESYLWSTLIGWMPKYSVDLYCQQFYSQHYDQETDLKDQSQEKSGYLALVFCLYLIVTAQHEIPLNFFWKKATYLVWLMSVCQYWIQSLNSYVWRYLVFSPPIFQIYVEPFFSCTIFKTNDVLLYRHVPLFCFSPLLFCHELQRFCENHTEANSPIF